MPVICENHNQIINVIARPYHKHICSNVLKTGNLYQRINPAILGFLNTTSCWRQIVLACFICKIAFDNKIDYENYCDNCIYNRREIKQVSVFEAYNITAKLSIIYTGTTEYFSLLLLNKCQRLLIGNLPRRLKVAAKQTYIFEEVLNKFALQTWPNNGLTSLKSPIILR